MPVTATGGLRELGAYFMGEAPVQHAARKISRTLTEMGIPHAVVGGIAVGVHGLLRGTEDVDVLITREGLAKFKERWLGLGWVNRFTGSKGVRDAEHNVKIDFLCTGEFPGDGKPGPLAFPDPKDVAEHVPDEGFDVIALPRLIELKLATVMTAPERPRDLDDVIRLIQKRSLPASFRDILHPYVQAKFDEAWVLAHKPKPFES